MLRSASFHAKFCAAQCDPGGATCPDSRFVSSIMKTSHLDRSVFRKSLNGACVSAGTLRSKHGPDRFQFHGMFQRELEATVFLHSVWPMPAASLAEFIDINMNLPRIIKSYWDQEAGQPKPGSSPWRSQLPTLTGSCNIVARLRIGDTVVIRLLECFEVMRLIGWDDAQWQAERMQLPAERPDSFPELISNMAGNAYSVYHFGPWVLALFAVYGKFWSPAVPSSSSSEDGGCVQDDCPCSSSCNED